LTEGRTVILHTEVEYSYIFIKLGKLMEVKKLKICYGSPDDIDSHLESIDYCNVYLFL